ncbi:MAG: hypothetical protein ACI9IO_000671 [Cyanobium sp.]
MAQSKQQQGIVQGNPHRNGVGWAHARQGAQRSRPVLRQHLQKLSLATRGEGFINITAALDAEIAASGLQQGLAAYLWALVLRQLR